MDPETMSDAAASRLEDGTPPRKFGQVALLASDTPRAQEAFSMLWAQRDWAPLDEADAAVVLGGDGFMLHVLHSMTDTGRVIPAYGMNRGTVGFLMNRYDKRGSVMDRLNVARGKTITPLRNLGSWPTAQLGPNRRSSFLGRVGRGGGQVQNQCGHCRWNPPCVCRAGLQVREGMASGGVVVG